MVAVVLKCPCFLKRERVKFGVLARSEAAGRGETMPPVAGPMPKDE